MFDSQFCTILIACSLELAKVCISKIITLFSISLHFTINSFSDKGINSALTADSFCISFNSPFTFLSALSFIIPW